MKLNIPESLKTLRLQLRKLEPTDAQAIFAYAADPAVTTYVSWPTHRDLDDTQAFIEYAHYAWNNGIEYVYGLILPATNQLIGTIGLTMEAGRVAVGYVVAQAHWGNGYASEVVRAMAWLLKEQPNVHRIWACVDVEQPASARVLTKAGFVKEGVIQKWATFPNQGTEEPRAKDCLFYYFPH